jgi:hypothetical protein
MEIFVLSEVALAYLVEGPMQNGLKAHAEPSLRFGFPKVISEGSA